MPRAPGLFLSHLPAIYQTSEDLRELLAVFEAVMFGTGAGDHNEGPRQRFRNEGMPLAEAVANIASLFDVSETPREFVQWLAQWVALTDLSGLAEERQRRLLSKIVPLYAKRGTKNYVEELLKFFMPDDATVLIDDQNLQGFVVGAARIGLDSWLAFDRPFWFAVTILLPAPSGGPGERAELRTQWEQRVRRVIDLAKPAHTLYELVLRFNDSEEGDEWL
jgi:phage tail-like protein